MTRKLASDEFILVKSYDEDQYRHIHFWRYVSFFAWTG